MGEISQVETKGRDMDLVPEKEMENLSGQTAELAGNQQSGKNCREMSSVCLSVGSRAVMRTESNSMPRKIKHVVGPTHLSGDKGLPISITAWSI